MAFFGGAGKMIFLFPAEAQRTDVFDSHRAHILYRSGLGLQESAWVGEIPSILLPMKRSAIEFDKC